MKPSDEFDNSFTNSELGISGHMLYIFWFSSLYKKEQSRDKETFEIQIIKSMKLTKWQRVKDD